VTRVQGGKVKYSNRNNSAADRSISIKFGTAFQNVTCNTLGMFKVEDQGYGVKHHVYSVIYLQQKRYNTAMERFSDFKRGMAS